MDKRISLAKSTGCLSCYCPKSQEEPEDFECSKCDAFVCDACCQEGKDELLKWYSGMEGIEDQMTEEEFWANEELIGEALEDGDFYCPKCYQKVI